MATANNTPVAKKTTVPAVAYALQSDFPQMSSENKRELLMRGRMLNETTYYINESNNKWLSIGVAPSFSNNEMNDFSIRIILAAGDKRQQLNMNGINELCELFKAIRSVDLFKCVFMDVSRSYHSNLSEINQILIFCFCTLNI